MKKRNNAVLCVQPRGIDQCFHKYNYLLLRFDTLLSVLKIITIMTTNNGYNNNDKRINIWFFHIYKRTKSPQYFPLLSLFLLSHIPLFPSFLHSSPFSSPIFHSSPPSYSLHSPCFHSSPSPKFIHVSISNKPEGSSRSAPWQILVNLCDWLSLF